jgi:hypothetical protein
MAMAIAYDEAKKNPIRKKENDSEEIARGRLLTQFFSYKISSARATTDFPDAFLSNRVPGRVSGPHFHIVDQFQVTVGGKGKIGRHDLTPYSAHFARAYTPYGPLFADTDIPLTYFTLRAHHDPGSQHLPQALDKLKQVPNRQPWQITRPLFFPTLQSGTAAADTILQAVPDITDDKGLAAYTLSMKPNTKAHAPDPSYGDGQYLVVVKGSLLHDNKEHNALALVFIYPKEGPFPIHAGSEGLEAMILNFPAVANSSYRA